MASTTPTPQARAAAAQGCIGWLWLHPHAAYMSHYKYRFGLIPSSAMLREDRMSPFAREALIADAEIEAGAEVYRAEDVHAWLYRLAYKSKAKLPKPWRK